MESKFHRWWLAACVAALLLASWVGGFSVAVTSVFVVIYLTGVTLIGPDDKPVDVLSGEPVDVVAAEPGWLADEVTEAPVDVVAAAPEDAYVAAAAPAAALSAVDVQGPADEPAAIEAAAEIVAEEVTEPKTEGELKSDDADAENAAEAESTAEVNPEPVAEDDDAVPYPDDFEDESAAEVEEPTPA